VENDNGFLLIPSALLMESQPSLDQWEAMAARLCDYQRSMYWWIGDLLVYGEAQLGDDIYQCFDPSMSLSLVQRCAAVSREFTLAERHPELSWTQHQLVTKMAKPLRQAVLLRSLAEGWDTGQLRDHINLLKE
jgi:hypothetical protein